MEMRVQLKIEVLRASGCRYFLIGPSEAIESSSTRKQANKMMTPTFGKSKILNINNIA
jgi:hypothetical protein